MSMDAMIAVAAVTWRQLGPDRWVTGDGRGHVEWLPLFTAWQWTAPGRTGHADTASAGREQVEEVIGHG